MNLRRATLWAATALLVGGIGYTSAVTTMLVVERAIDPGPQVDTVAAVPVEGDPEVEQRELAEYEPVLEQNIFGAARSEPEPEERSVRRGTPFDRPTPETGLPEPPQFELRVTGTFLAGDDSFAMAVAQGEQEEKVYRVGDCVPELDGKRESPCTPRQGRLTGIAREGIVLVRNGERLDLELTEEVRNAPTRRSGISRRSSTRDSVADRRAEAASRRQEARERLAAARRRAVQTRTTEEPQDTTLPSGDTFPVEQTGENSYEYTVPNADVEQAFENFSEIVGQAAAVPIIENGEPQGFELRKIRSGSIFERLGLKNNDLIHGVNGESLTTADQALRLFTLFRNETEIVLDVTRDNRRIQLAYSIE